MKRFSIAVLFAMLIAGCSSIDVVNQSASSGNPVKKLKAGFFVGRGSSGNGVYWLARILYHSPQVELTLLDGKDIQNGKLDGLDLLVVPGGDSWAQYADVTEKGGEQIRKFVKNGGGYWGICAGFHCALNKPDRFRLTPYTFIDGVRGYRAKLAMDINERGAEVLGIKKGRYFVQYSRGPISRKHENWPHGNAETLGIYKSTVSNLEKPSNFMNAPAIIYGTYGKGKVAATSFHPEVTRENDVISTGCIYAVTGVRPTPVYPVKNYRPVRVAFFASYTLGKEPIRQLLELDVEKDLDVSLMSQAQLGDGMLLHTDVVVMPDANVKGKTITINMYRKEFEDFLARNGKIIAGKKLAGVLPKHKNVVIIESNASFVKEALKR